MYKATGNNYQRMTVTYVFRGDRGIGSQADLQGQKNLLDKKMGWVL